MKEGLTTLLIIILCIGSACSSSKWVVENQKEIDRNDFKLLNSEMFLERVGISTPNSPILSYQLKAKNTFEYAQRIKTDRYIQRYKPTLRSVLFGLVGAGIASTAAVTIDQSNTSKNILFGTAGFVTLASVLNMRPSGEATSTGESKLLRKTGKIEETEVINAIPDPDLEVTYSIFYDRDAIILQKDIITNNSVYSINLIEDLNPEIFDYDSSDVIVVEVYFNDETYSERISLKNIFESFVVVSSQVTALRDEPELNSRNVLTDLAFGSQMKLADADSLWYKVFYGISETWISKTDAYPIWRPSEFASQLSIIAIPNIPFGNVDVERDIPVLKENNDSRLAFIFSNGEYQGSLSERTYAERDARLMDEYLQKALGIPSTNISKALNIESQQQLTLAYNRLASSTRVKREQIIVFLSGYATVNSNNELAITNVGNKDNSYLNLNSLAEGISRLNADEIIVFADLDFIGEEKGNAALKEFSDIITSAKPTSAIIFGSTENQRSRDYSIVNGDQKRHSIFTYFVIDAIKKGETTVSGILNHLQRNVDYTSRRLHNQPQNVTLFGDPSISLID